MSVRHGGYEGPKNPRPTSEHQLPKRPPRGRRVLELDLVETPSVNRLLRMHHRDRSRIRDAVWAQAMAQKPRGWTPLERFRIDAELRVWAPRDPLELAGCLKLHVDALAHAGIIADDSRNHLVVGEVTQVVDRGNRGVTVRLHEVSLPTQGAEAA